MILIIRKTQNWKYLKVITSGDWKLAIKHDSFIFLLYCSSLFKTVYRYYLYNKNRMFNENIEEDYDEARFDSHQAKLHPIFLGVFKN